MFGEFSSCGNLRFRNVPVEMPYPGTRRASSKFVATTRLRYALFLSAVQIVAREVTTPPLIFHAMVGKKKQVASPVMMCLPPATASTDTVYGGVRRLWHPSRTASMTSKRWTAGKWTAGMTRTRRVAAPPRISMMYCPDIGYDAARRDDDGGRGRGDAPD
eukprot:3136600-Rhodomonas_salina.1